MNYRRVYASASLETPDVYIYSHVAERLLARVYHLITHRTQHAREEKENKTQNQFFLSSFFFFFKHIRTQLLLSLSLSCYNIKEII